MATNYDLLVDLYDLKQTPFTNDKVQIKRVLPPDSDKVIEFILKEFTEEWASEAKSALYRANPNCFIAVRDEKVIGFACYDATAKGFFGPLGVSKDARGLGLGIILVQKTLKAMRDDGYAYAIIGGASVKTQPFYEKACGNILPIPNSRKIYLRMVRNIKI